MQRGRILGLRHSGRDKGESSRTHCGDGVKGMLAIPLLAMVAACGATTPASKPATTASTVQAPLSDEGLLCVNYAKPECISNPTPERRAALDVCAQAERDGTPIDPIELCVETEVLSREAQSSFSELSNAVPLIGR
jgi:hypothetical protein